MGIRGSRDSSRDAPIRHLCRLLAKRVHGAEERWQDVVLAWNARDLGCDEAAATALTGHSRDVGQFRLHGDIAAVTWAGQ